MTYLITSKNLFSAAVLISNLKENYKTNPECKFTVHTPLFIEAEYRYIEYGGIINLLKEHAIKVVYKKKLKNSTKYTTMEL